MKETKFLVIAVLIACSFASGLAVYAALRSFDAYASLRDATQRKYAEDIRGRLENISRLGTIQEIAGDRITLAVASQSFSGNPEVFAFHLAPNVTITKRTLFLEENVIIGFRDEEGKRSDVHQGIVVYATIHPKDGTLEATRILYGDPFPIP